MCAVAQLVAAPDSLYVCTGAHAVPLLWCKFFGLILIVWRQQPCKRVSTACSPLSFKIMGVLMHLLCWAKISKKC